MIMEAIRAEVNSILPITFYRKETLTLDHEDDQECTTSFESVKAEICETIRGLAKQDINKKVLILQGGYGCGKSSLLKRIITEIGADKEEFDSQSLWLTQFSAYATLESLFLFLAEKAEKLGIRDSSQALKRTTGDLATRKDAAFKTLYHCKVLLIDDIDASVSFDFGFLDKIMCKELITIGTCTGLLNNKLEATKIFPIPDKGLHSSDVKSTLLSNGIDAEKTNTVIQLADKLGPLFGSVLTQAVINNILSMEETVDLNSKTANHNDLIERVFLKIFSKLSVECQSILVDVGFLRTPLSFKDEKLFDLLLKLGLLKKHKISEGKCLIQAPNCITMILKKLENVEGVNLLANENGKKPTTLDLWFMILPGILKDLVKEAESHAWPFVPEAWQFKDVIGDAEKYNLKDVIHKKNEYADIDEIDVLKECLFSALVEENYKSASAILFIMDRFIYWQGLSKTGLKVAKYIEKKSPNTAIAPQIVIRKVRVMKNNGDIQGAGKALDSLIDSKINLGQWIYKLESDQQLVTSVCVQIKGDIFRGLGLWTQASIDLIKSIFGFKSLPKVDKKGWASSLSLLADAYQYMSLEDFRQKIKPRFKLTSDHPILEAIKCVNEASELSIYSPLFFTKNKRRAGELMLIYTEILPENSSEVGFYLKYAATELIQGLKCHTSVSSLESREQFYEFVFCVYKLSQALAKLYKLHGNSDSSLNGTAKALLALALKLYEHYCSFELKLHHDDWSTMLIQTTLLLLNLTKLPLNESPKLPAAEPSKTPSKLAAMNGEAKTLQSQNTQVHAVPQEGRDLEDGAQGGSGTVISDDGEVGQQDGTFFQQQSTVATDEIDIKTAITASDTCDGDERANYRQDTTASSNKFTSERSQRRNEIQNQSTVATEDESSDALKEELERMRGYSGSEIGADAQGLLGQKLAQNEIAISDELTSVNQQWTGRTNYIQQATTATETAEKLDDKNSTKDEKQENGSGNGNEERDARADELAQEDVGIEDRDEEDAGIEDRDEEDAGIIVEGEFEDSGVGNRDEGNDSGIIDKYESKTTYLTEEDYLSNDIFKKRLRTTMATFEGTVGTREKDVRQIENTLNVLRHSKAKVYNAKVWRYDPLTLKWTTSDTLAYIGDKLKLGDKEGACRDAFMVEYINQEEPMGRYIGKQYKLEKYKENPRTLRQYKQDVVCQVTSRYYATLFSQEMFRKGLQFGQVQFLPAVVLELNDVENDPEKYYNVEPYLAGNFTKITNNLSWVEQGDVQGKDLLLALSHFSFCASRGRILIVDIQGWTSRDQSGATFLTDPQIHTRDKKGFGTANRGMQGFNQFWASQHPTCSGICTKLGLKRPNST